jgi:hypothetical protein
MAVKYHQISLKDIFSDCRDMFIDDGVYAFIRREIGHYMFLQNQYVFFDFEEPLIFFLADYMAVMALFVWVSHYFSKGLRYIIQKRKTI